MKWFMNEDSRDDDNEIAIRKLFLYVIMMMTVVAIVAFNFVGCTTLDQNIKWEAKCECQKCNFKCTRSYEKKEIRIKK